MQNVVQELRGEKIDIISYHVTPAKYVVNALAPAEPSRVIIDESNKSMEVIVPDEFLSIAIGKRGLNVRLASKLTEWHLDVLSEERYDENVKEGYDSLLSLPGVGESLAEALYDAGVASATDLSETPIEELTPIKGIGEDKAQKLIDIARDFVSQQEALDEASAEAPAEEPTDNTPSEADEMDAGIADEASPNSADN